MRRIKVIVERHEDGFVAFPLGVEGVVVGAGDTYEDALADLESALRFHAESFGPEVLSGDPPVLEAFLTETAV